MNKIVIIVLIAIVVVFFVFVGVGSFKSEPKKTNPKDVEAPQGSESFSDFFGFLQEKVVLRCEQKSPAGSSRQCEKLPIGNITIPPAADSFFGKSTFRTVRLELLEGRAAVSYLDKKGSAEFDNPQEFDLPNSDNDDSKIEAIVVLENGGTLNISCRGNSSCRVGQR